jgi:uncharacterized membrane protein
LVNMAGEKTVCLTTGKKHMFLIRSSLVVIPSLIIYHYFWWFHANVGWLNHPWITMFDASIPICQH